MSDTEVQGPLTPIFSNQDLTMYERKELTMFGINSFYYWAAADNKVHLHGPYPSVLSATGHFEKLKAERLALPNVIHVNFHRKQRMAGAPPGSKSLWTICECGHHYDEGLRNQCPSCGRHPVRLFGKE